MNITLQIESYALSIFYFIKFNSYFAIRKYTGRVTPSDIKNVL